MHSDGSHTVIKMEANAKKKISTLWRALPNSQHFFSCSHGAWFSEKGPFMFIVQVDWFWFIVHTTGSVSSSSIPVTASLPPLEWPLSHQSGSYELRIEVQPKPHHRAHYETEGSRGAVKAPTGGHPVVQVWTRILFTLCSVFVTRWWFLLSHCLLLVRLRYVSYYSWGNGKFKIKIEGSLFELDKNRHDIHAQATPSLFFLVEKLLELCRHSCIDRRFLKASFGV